MKLKTAFLGMLCLFLSFQSFADVSIYHVDLSTDEITLFNHTGSAHDLTNDIMTINGNFEIIGGMNKISGDFNLAASGFLVVKAANALGAMGSISLAYASTPPGNPDRYDLYNFVQWGFKDQPHQDTAVAAGYWGAGEFVPCNAGDKLQRDGDFSSWGGGRWSVVVGLNEFDMSQNISFYPNPVSSVLNLDFSTAATNEEFDIQILDITGKVVHQLRYNGETHLKVDVNGYASGLYFASIVNKDGVILNHKFMVK